MNDKVLNALKEVAGLTEVARGLDLEAIKNCLEGQDGWVAMDAWQKYAFAAIHAAYARKKELEGREDDAISIAATSLMHAKKAQEALEIYEEHKKKK